MRLWHWKLIPALPKQQLLGQWRECCLIAKNIAENGTPNHILVSPIMNYPIDEFIAYWLTVGNEMQNRDYHVNETVLCTLKDKGASIANAYRTYIHPEKELFEGWHDDQYLMQCYYNLQEKHDRGGISDEEWQKIQEVVDNGISP